MSSSLKSHPGPTARITTSFQTTCASLSLLSKGYQLHTFKKRNLLEGHIMNHWKENQVKKWTAHVHTQKTKNPFCIKEFCVWKEIHASEMESPGKGPMSFQ